MIEMPTEAERLSQPAEDSSELFDRLSRYLSETVRIVRPNDSSLYTTILVAKLQQIWGYQPDQGFYYALCGDDPKSGSGRELRLDCSYEVLIDGQWKVIHLPAELENSPRGPVARSISSV